MFFHVREMMHLEDAFIQKAYFLPVHVFPGNQTHFGVVSATQHYSGNRNAYSLRLIPHAVVRQGMERRGSFTAMH